MSEHVEAKDAQMSHGQVGFIRPIFKFLYRSNEKSVPAAGKKSSSSNLPDGKADFLQKESPEAVKTLLEKETSTRLRWAQLTTSSTSSTSDCEFSGIKSSRQTHLIELIKEPSRRGQAEQEDRWHHNARQDSAKWSIPFN